MFTSSQMETLHKTSKGVERSYFVTCTWKSFFFCNISSSIPTLGISLKKETYDSPCLWGKSSTIQQLAVSMHSDWKNPTYRNIKMHIADIRFAKAIQEATNIDVQQKNVRVQQKIYLTWFYTSCVTVRYF
jgi:hypothetical protein